MQMMSNHAPLVAAEIAGVAYNGRVGVVDNRALIVRKVCPKR